MKRKDTERHVRFSPATTDRPGFFVDRHSHTSWHGHSYRVLYADTDAAQVVYHANYLRFFEVGRVEMMRAIGQTHKQIEELGFYHPIVDLTMHFYKPLRYDDGMVIFTRPRLAERVRVIIDYRIIAAASGDLSCAGSTVHACLRKHDLMPVALDPITLQMMQFFAQIDGDVR